VKKGQVEEILEIKSNVKTEKHKTKSILPVTPNDLVLERKKRFSKG
jgi:hypothetical protein